MVAKVDETDRWRDFEDARAVYAGMYDIWR